MKNHKIAEQDVDSPGELSNYDNHPAEIATELFQFELNNALKVHEEHLLQEINEALDKIDNGKYGKCEICGEEISYERSCKHCLIPGFALIVKQKGGKNGNFKESETCRGKGYRYA